MALEWIPWTVAPSKAVGVSVVLLCVMHLWALWAFGSFAPAAKIVQGSEHVPLPSLAPHTVVGWGACNKHDRDQRFWGVVGRALTLNETRRADGFVWLGDAIYADDLGASGWRTSSPTSMAAKYTAFRQSLDYAQFRNKLLAEPSGVWDDHDMGADGASRSFELKSLTQQLYLDFLAVPKTSPRRRRDGVYHLHTVPFHNTSTALTTRFDFAVCFVLLDARFHRDDPKVPGADILGEEQWQWLWSVLVDPTDEVGEPRVARQRDLFSRCAFTAVANGIQVLSDEKPTENWGVYPGARERLLRTLALAGAQRFVLLSGDVHYADYLTVPHMAFGTDGIVEITSSGLTHSLADVGVTPEVFDLLNANPRRAGRFIGRSFGSIAVTDTTAVVSVHEVTTGAVVLQHAVNIDTVGNTLLQRDHRFGIDVVAAPSKRLFHAMDRLPFTVSHRVRLRIIDLLASGWCALFH
uniref:PhoD-like phosphatase metallophosphatase domain-containing protein n=1 Tax=Neobodo designis TaxID=312471 RepID=A0A7S1PZ53_NEODS